MKDVIQIRVDISHDQKEIIKNYVEAKRKRFGVKKDGSKFNQPDAIKDIILLSKDLVNEKIAIWAKEMEEFKNEEQIALNKRFAQGA